MAQRSKKPSRQAAMLEHTVPEGCGKSVDGAALTMLSGELIQVDTKTRNGQSLLGQDSSLFCKANRQRFKIPERGFYGTKSEKLTKQGTLGRSLFCKPFRNLQGKFKSFRLLTAEKKKVLFERAVG